MASKAQDNPFASPGGTMISSENSSIVIDSPHPLGGPKFTSPQPTISSTPRHQHHPLPHSAARIQKSRSCSKSSPAESLVDSARKEWKQHGSALTQDMEEIRRLDEARPGTMTARLLSAKDRRDVTGNKYTAYILRVKLANNQVLQLEHRYSEFVKLNDSFKNQCVHLDAEFPPKHLAGRLGNWTPSLTWAPDHFEELVKYRKVQ